MSVLKNRQLDSPAKYVQIANSIYSETLAFVVKLSARYQRFLGADAMKLATEVIDNAERGNNIRIIDDVSYERRKLHLLNARSAASALDIHMSHIWKALMLNPQGAFTNSKGVTKSSSEAQYILDSMAFALGNNLDLFMEYVEKVMKSDEKRYKQISK